MRRGRAQTRRRRRRGRGGRRGGRDDVRDDAAPVDGDFDDAVADVSSEDADEDSEEDTPEPARGRRDRGGRRGGGRPAVRSEFADDEESLEPDDFETVSQSEEDDEDDEDDDPVEPGSWGPVPTWEEAIEFLLRPDLVEIDPSSPGGQSARGSTSDGARSATRHYGPRK